MVKLYKSREGAPFNNDQAQIFGERIEVLIKNNNGKITPNLIVEDGKEKTSPFHSQFTWDDTEAARKHRLYEAKRIVQNVVEIVIISDKPTLVRSFFSVSDNEENQKVYVQLNTMLTEKDYRNQHIDRIIATFENATKLLTLLKSYS